MIAISDEEIYELREQGLTHKEIADYFTSKGLKVNTSTIYKHCKKIYEKNGQSQPDQRVRKKINGIKDEEIFELREQGLSLQEIADYFTRKGVKVTLDTIYDRCKKIYAEKGKKQPTQKGSRKQKGINDEEIFELREQGLSLQEIADYFSSKGLKVSRQAINLRCKKIYREKGKKQIDQRIKNGRRIKGINDEEIFELREEGLSYQKIADYFASKGLKISKQKICKCCKKIYEEKGKKQPDQRIQNGKWIKGINDEEIYRLREHGLKHKEIAEYFTSKGIKISEQGICKRCKKIYEEKGKKQPDQRIQNGRRIKEITDEEIFELREQGLTHQEIADYFTSKGFHVNSNTIYERCRKIYEKKGQKQPDQRSRVKIKEITDNEIYELREQGLTLKEIADYFTSKGLKTNQTTIGKRCIKIYEEKGEKQPKQKIRKINGITDEDIYNLREQGLSYKEIANYYTRKGFKLYVSKVYRWCKKIYEEKGQNQPDQRGRRKKEERVLHDLEKKLQELSGKKKESEELLRKSKELDENKKYKGEEK